MRTRDREAPEEGDQVIHCLKVLIARNERAAIREAGHAIANGNRDLREEIFNADPDLDNQAGYNATLCVAREKVVQPPRGGAAATPKRACSPQFPIKEIA